MAIVTYRGPHPEPSITMRVPNDGLDIHEHITLNKTNSVVTIIALPTGVPRPVSPFVALWLAAVRQPEGPWIDIRLARGEWAACQRATLRLTDHLPRDPTRYHMSVRQHRRLRRWVARDLRRRRDWPYRRPWLHHASDCLRLFPQKEFELLRGVERGRYAADNQAGWSLRWSGQQRGLESGSPGVKLRP